MYESQIFFENREIHKFIWSINEQSYNVLPNGNGTNNKINV